MSGRQKTAKGKRRKRKKQEKRIVDEYQLRRNLRTQQEARDTLEMSQKPVIIPDKEEYLKDIRIGGIEGGGTQSLLIIMDGKGNKLTEVKGPLLNHWAVGIQETAARVNAMIERGKELLEIPKSVPLACLGLALSGCEDNITNRHLLEICREEYPNATNDYFISSDTLGSLRTGLENGGIVLISGTGSNALLVNSNGETHRCGGWGYLMGDEGSAYWIAHRACKYVFDDMDDFMKAPYPISYVWPAMRSFFNAKERTDVLRELYSNFDKSKIAMFTKELAVGCEREDPLCLLVFEDASRFLARHVVTLSKKAHNDLKLAHGGLKIICIGSVWNSWKFLKNGFVDEIHNGCVVDELTLLQLTTSSALGACYLAAEKIDCPFVKPYHENVKAFFHYNRANYKKVDKMETLADVMKHLVPCDNKS